MNNVAKMKKIKRSMENLISTENWVETNRKGLKSIGPGNYIVHKVYTIDGNDWPRLVIGTRLLESRYKFDIDFVCAERDPSYDEKWYSTSVPLHLLGDAGYILDKTHKILKSGDLLDVNKNTITIKIFEYMDMPKHVRESVIDNYCPSNDTLKFHFTEKEHDGDSSDRLIDDWLFEQGVDRGEKVLLNISW